MDDTISKLLRNESKRCQTANGAIMLQAVAAWLEGIEIFDTHEEIWETADRLCGQQSNVTVETCGHCGGAIIKISGKLCVCYASHLSMCCAGA
jgi:hypothetical protein